MNRQELKAFLEEKYRLYNQRSFIEQDPVSIPHRFSWKEDIEIAAFLSATIAWGQRPVIIKNAALLMRLMDDSPADFVRNFTSADLPPFRKFVHRTFNGTDCVFFLRALQNIYLHRGGLEKCFSGADAKISIHMFRKIFFSGQHPARSRKHISDPEKGAAAKRLNMFLRWMVRKDGAGVDFGIWKSISPANLMCPLDVHTGNIARKLGLLRRKQDDWKAVELLTGELRTFDASDPVKYDLSLFGLGAFEGF